VPADLLAFALATALAAEPATPPEEPPVALLEFLGLWITDEGTWIDPEILDALPEPEGEAKGASPAPPTAPDDHTAAQGRAEETREDAHD
jgi:hypothetical protein